MKIWRFEFASSTPGRQVWGAVAGVTALLALLLTLQTYMQARATHAHAVARLEKARDSMEGSDKLAPLADKEGLALAKRQLAVPWLPLLDHIGAQAGQGVEVLAIEPDADAGSVKISAEARDTSAMLAFADRLAVGAMLRGTHISQHQLVEHEGGRRALQFEVRASWVVLH